MPSLHPAAALFGPPPALLTLLVFLTAPLHAMTAAHLAPALFGTPPALLTLLVLSALLHTMTAAHLAAAFLHLTAALIALRRAALLSALLHAMTAAHLAPAILHLAAALLALRRPARLSASAALGLVRRLLPGHFGLGHGKSGSDAEGQCKRAFDQDLSHGRNPTGLDDRTLKTKHSFHHVWGGTLLANGPPTDQQPPMLSAAKSDVAGAAS
jgi:hypothetical protein